MTYKVETTTRFNKGFKNLDHYTQRMIKSWINKHLVDCEDPRATGKALTGNYAGLCRYRVGDYRIICEIKDEELIILALTVGHRMNIYN